MFPRFTLGDTFSLTDSLADYPASAGWVLHHRFMPDVAGSAIELTSTASDDDHATTATAAATVAWVAGDYTWASWVVLGAVSHSIDSGKVVFVANPRTANSGLDLRTDAQVALDNVRATIRGTATQGVLSYTIGGRQLQRYSMAELLTLESKLTADVQREQRITAVAAGQADSRKVYVRIGRA